jgi:ferredoxin--NADP+ reductase
MKGLVTDALKKIIDREKVSLVMAVGPVVMMRAISELTKEHGIKTIVSLNPIMVDGTGMCGGCRVVIDGKNKFACVDGPDFDAHQVDFDNLMMRQRAYLTEERLSFENYQCKAVNAAKVV